MTLPASAPVVQCTLSKPLLAEGTVGVITAAFLSIDRDLVLESSGETIYKEPVPITPLPDGTLAFDVIPVDTNNILDNAGHLIKNWVYTLRVTLTLANSVQKTVTYAFQPVSGSDMDLDLVPQVGAVSAPAVVVADVLKASLNLSDLTDDVAARLNLGIDQVSNTSDMNKPVSTAQQTAISNAQSAAETTAAADATTKANAAQANAEAAAAADATTKANAAQANAEAAAAADATTKANAAQAASLQKSANLSDLASVATAKTNLGLDQVTNTSDQNKPVSTAQQNALDAKANLTRTINARTASYTFVAADAGAFVTMNTPAAATLTVPDDASVAFPVGTVIEGSQLGAGQLSLAGAAGVTVNATPGLKLAAQYGTYGLIKIAANTWLAYGRLAA